ncbi:hypothetical protein AB834_04700 [PVC group bacterium (ex Bugula neritina AB1)]|nr:hypothetical protein AB834_04700 [PVC group bacterium (ex Bugula neritina AB1)]
MIRGVRRDVKYKIFSLILALIIWVYIRGEMKQAGFLDQRNKAEEQLTLSDIPIHILSLPSLDMRSISVSPTLMSLKVSAPALLTKSLSAKNVTAYVKLIGLMDGKYETLVHVDVPPGVRVISEIDRVQVTVRSSDIQTPLSGLNYSESIYTSTEKEEIK